MACSSEGAMERRQLQFLKIRILESMGTDIGYFLQSQGAENFMDAMDLTCGAIPAGSFNEVIDIDAAHQFLELYMGIAKYRFAFAVSQALKINEGFYPAIRNYCFEKGKTLKPENLNAVSAAFEVIESCVLDGMPCDETKKVVTNEENLIEWEKITDTHESFWEKCGSSADVYYDLQSCFIQGLLDGSCIKFINVENSKFSLTK